jgi:prophage regulatory protein
VTKLLSFSIVAAMFTHEPPMNAQSRTPTARAAVKLPEDLDRLIDMKVVEQITGLKRTAINERVKVGAFIQPVRLSARCTRWRLSEVQSWVAGLSSPVPAEAPPRRRRRSESTGAQAGSAA